MNPDTIQTIIGILGIIITCVTTTLGVAAWTSRFVTKDHLENTTDKLELVIKDIGITLHEISTAITDLRVIEERVSHLSDKMNDINERLTAMENRWNDHLTKRED